jgi:hypothetical protein
MISAGLPLAGQRVTLRLDGPIAHILSGGILARTIACPVPQEVRPRLRGARAGTAQPPHLPEPLTVPRRVSVRGAIMIGGQKIQVGLAHARKTVEVTVEADTYQITVDPDTTITAPFDALRAVARETTDDEVAQLLSSHWRPRVMGAWLVSGRASRLGAALLESLETLSWHADRTASGDCCAVRLGSEGRALAQDLPAAGLRAPVGLGLVRSRSTRTTRSRADRHCHR